MPTHLHLLHCCEFEAAGMDLRGYKLQGVLHPDIKPDSAAYDYEIPDNDTFYLMASSGVNPEGADLADDVSTNWIGAPVLSRLDAHGF